MCAKWRIRDDVFNESVIDEMIKTKQMVLKRRRRNEIELFVNVALIMPYTSGINI